MAPPPAKVPFIVIQEKPRIYIAAIPGKWLYNHSTPSMRIRSPQLGFQRKVGVERAEKIARDVLNEHRTLPNAVVVATDEGDFDKDHGLLVLPDRIRFLVLDGQHRVFAAHYAHEDSTYAVTMHLGMNREEMARIFLEINDTQKRVPASLRWDLYRLVNPTNDKFRTVAAQLVYEFATRDGSPLQDRIDLTGEKSTPKLKQASIAPEIRSLVAKKSLPLRKLDFEGQYTALHTYLSAIRSLDPDGWDDGTSVFYQARILRALLKLFGDILRRDKRPIGEATVPDYTVFLERLDTGELQPEKIRKIGGVAGVKAIHSTMFGQVFGK